MLDITDKDCVLVRANDTVHVQMGVFICVYVSEKLGHNCFFELLLVYCILYVFLLFKSCQDFQFSSRKKKGK